MSDFSPIAIVGRGLVLPKAHTTAAFWQNVEQGVDCVEDVPADGRWGIAPSLVTGTTDDSVDKMWSTKGGYITGFDADDACEGTLVDKELLLQLDPVVQWSLSAAKQALLESKVVPGADGSKVGCILGNLSFPTSKLAQFGEEAFLQQASQAAAAGELSQAMADMAAAKKTHPLNRFMSGLPSAIVSEALGLHAGSFSLDAACASSLYAVQFAADALHTGRADVMLAGAVNAADSLFIHVGFCALNALSKTGQTRPFHRDADGLLPGEGAGVLALMRLEDAQQQGKHILGVIRGVGLSNDGRGRNLLAPSTEGQVRAIRRAWQRAGVDPSTANMLECHATGTSLGDLTEVNSLRSVFGEAAPRSIGMGSLKSNMGHLITGAGVAGMLKVLGSFENNLLPKTLHTDAPLDVFSDETLPFALATEARPFERQGDNARRAAVSAFGFGGNNAHVIVDDYQERDDGLAPLPKVASVDTVITGMGVRIGEHDSVPSFISALLDDDIHPLATQASVNGAQVRFPPNSLRSSLPQQLHVFEAVREAAELLPADLDNTRVGVLIGMECDVDVTTPGIRWRLKHWAQEWNAGAKLGLTDDAIDAWADAMRDASAPVVDAEGVLGQMPNIPANRMSVQLDLRGPGFTISAEEISGLAALRTAQDFLARGELDAVLVGAVDVCGDFRHEAAVRGLAAHEVTSADAAVVFVVRRLGDVAEKDILAHLSDVELGTTRSVKTTEDDAVVAHRTALSSETAGENVLPLHPHASASLLDVACAVYGVSHGVLPTTSTPWITDGGSRTCRVVADSFANARGAVSVHRPATAKVLHRALPSVLALGADSKGALHQQLKTLLDDDNALREALTTKSLGAVRLAVVGKDADALRAQLRRAEVALAEGKDPIGPDIAFSVDKPVSVDDVALVFGGAGNPKLGLGNNLLVHFPEVQDLLHSRTRSLRTHWRAEALFEGGDHQLTYLDQLLIASCQMQAQARVLDDVLGVKAGSALGFSLGEANAFCATGVFDEWSELLDEVDANTVFRDSLAGPMHAVRNLWRDKGHPDAAESDRPYTSHLIQRSVNVVRPATEGEDLCFVTLIHSDNECVIGGHPDACQRVVDKLDLPDGVSMELPYIPSVHSEIVAGVSGELRKIHTRHVDNTDTRIFRMADGEVLDLTTEGCADAIVAQAITELDFPRVVRSAAHHGVKLFITMGAGNLASWIRDTQTDSPADVLAMPPGNRGPMSDSGIRFARFAANLFAKGLDVNLSAFKPDHGPLKKAAPKFTIDVPGRRSFTFPLPTPPAATTTSTTSAPQAHASTTVVEDRTMRPAPELPPVPRLPVLQKPAPTAGHMPLPPALPRLTADGLVADAAAAALPTAAPAATQASVEVPAMPQPTTPAPLAVAAPVVEVPATAQDAAALALAQTRQYMQQAHSAFVESQSAIHQHFLASRSTAMQNFTALAQQQPAGYVPVAVPAQPAPMAPPPVSAPVVTTPAAVPTPAPVVAKPVAAPVVAKPAAPAPSTTMTVTAASDLVGGSDHEEVVTLAARRNLDEVKARSQARQRPHHREGTRENPLYDQDDLEVLASDVISSVFPPLFKKQDAFKRQVRMPEPPLLLCDRVLRINAEPGVLETNKTIITESDVTWDDWYLDNGHIPPGILIESGQADLLLISWMGVDFDNAGERVYRLLGCDLQYGDRLPRAGDTLHYDIHIDGFASMGDTRMFFFHSDCRLGGPDGDIVLSVRNGQAGFFTDEELDNSGGILWTPADEEEDISKARHDAPKLWPTKTTFSREELLSFSQGDGFRCFGEGFEMLKPHVRTPSIQGPSTTGQDMLLMDRVTDLNTDGGPWNHGYMKSELDLHADKWFYDGHFKDDPCMPGTVMFEGCLQNLQFYLAACGYTVDKDGFRFEPVGHKEFNLRCRGQAIPRSKKLTYEILVKELDAGQPGVREPRIRADILCTVDGLKGLHCKNVEVQLVPDFPLNGRPDLLGERHKDSGWDAVGGVNSPLDDDDNVVFNQHMLLATGLGKPSEAFPGMYEPFDTGRPVPRLPGTPYHFMSRVTELNGPDGTPSSSSNRFPGMGAMKAGIDVAVEYDVPHDAWYFDENPADDMPFCVLLEVALQPCGWLSSYIGSALTSDDVLFYRNLDGKGTQHNRIGRDVGTLITRATITKTSSSAGMIIQEFKLSVTARAEPGAAETPVYDATTAFGFFPGVSLEQQVGVGSTDEQKAHLASACDFSVDLTDKSGPAFDGKLQLSDPMLLMIDRVTGYWPNGGEKGLGQVRTEKDVDLDEWFFKAHFFRDPVQPGSLGIEAMLQALQWQAIQEGMGQDMAKPTFEPIAFGDAMVWKYRGQVVPKNKLIQVTTDIVEKTSDKLIANASLWVDGLRIYSAEGIGIRIVDAG